MILLVSVGLLSIEQEEEYSRDSVCIIQSSEHPFKSPLIGFRVIQVTDFFLHLSDRFNERKETIQLFSGCNAGCLVEE